MRLISGLTAATLGLMIGTAPTAAAGEQTETMSTIHLNDGRGTEGHVVVMLAQSGRLTVDVDGQHRGQRVSDRLTVTSLTLMDGHGSYVAEAISHRTGQTLHLNPTEAMPQAVPALVVLGILARAGVTLALRQFTKTQVKKAAKSYLLSQKANKWSHIMASKHKWGTVGAKSREQVAELMSRAMIEGRHAIHDANTKRAVWNYQGKTIEVTYNRTTGQISNGWVR